MEQDRPLYGPLPTVLQASRPHSIDQGVLGRVAEHFDEFPTDRGGIAAEPSVAGPSLRATARPAPRASFASHNGTARRAGLSGFARFGSILEASDAEGVGHQVSKIASSL